MGVEERKKLLGALEGALNVRVLVYVTGDRSGMETRIAPDVLALASEHLLRIGFAKRLAVFLYTAGGDPIAGRGLVNLVRQYCEKFAVLVPFRALSCGTLIALGADEIVMGRHGLLSPIDPSVSSPFNPPAPGGQPGGPARLLPLSVEDMVGFLDLGKNELGLQSEESLLELLKVLAANINPLALGAVYRAREQSKLLATDLLKKHLADSEKVDFIVRRLTQELPTHGYLIGRAEVEESLGLPIAKVSEEVENLLWSLYREYGEWLRITQPATPFADLGQEQQKRVRYDRAVVESLQGASLVQHVFVTEKELMRVTVPSPGLPVPVEQVAERTIYEGWRGEIDGEVRT